ncbi:ABC transporter ATP-binding protein [Desulfobulbus alkaliphilus]|uniref:ABC transporter ATP-binding protein n=1 Tax=Desulfobulbus alkaliphilus TaxID=869814 RepID=UPI0019658827|nr:ABC transporter ATP-binding protein [Desulfobulbus alkaliphilus]MBM9536254.1 ABC transporter ATP-binding protein [Desulfobulbus alkaliphilus]
MTPDNHQDPSDEQESLIVVDGLTKAFNGITAVDRISFDVRQGELFGFLGPNGAGKTTTINMLTGLTRPDAGHIRIAGRDCSRSPKAAQDLIGIVPDESNLYPELTGFDNLCFCAALYGLRKQQRRDRAEELLEIFGLQDAARRKFGGYSKGMRRKLTIAAGIIHSPPLLFLDEPTTGIDVASARRIRQLIADLHRSGTTIFLTTHYIEEAERLCERIAFLVKGRIIEVDTVANLLQPVRTQHVLLLSIAMPAPELPRKLAAAFSHLTFSACSEEQIRVEAQGPINIAPLVRFCEEHGIEVIEARRGQPSLEEVFVRITGIEPDSMQNGKRGGK